MIALWMTLLPWIGALCLLLFKGWMDRFSRFLPGLVAAANVLLALLLNLQGSQQPTLVSLEMGNWPAPFGIQWVNDSLSSFFALVISLVLLALVLSRGFARDKEQQASSDVYSSAIVLILSGAAFGLLFTADLFNLFVLMEIASISLYALVARSRHPTAPVASMRYLLLGGVGSALYLLGIGVLYAKLGTLNMADIALKASSLNPAALQLVPLLLLLGLAVELEMFPFNAWVPQVYGAGGAFVPGFLAGVSSPIFALLLLRLVTVVFPVPQLRTVLLVAGLLTLVIGEFSALASRRLLKMLAFSSVGSMGMFLLLVSIPGAAMLRSSLFWLVMMLLAKVPLLGVAAYLQRQFGTDRFLELRGIFSQEKSAGLVFLLSAASITGIPLFAGFRAKIQALVSLASAQYWLLILPLLVSVLEFVYFFRAIRWMGMEPPESAGGKPVLPGSLEGFSRTGTLFLFSVFALLIVIFGLFPQGILDSIEVATTQLFDPVVYARAVLGGM
ncbi:MAG TPA: proton-conducting transporter membrane subunit [Thermotogota bacterium]|mgnify:CR=1 FL=1|nr:proton-conducting transporter membrane subunit [Thermotogota bacterium]HRW93438.1 proton-conducting transporter membrane subunit [Thermotogota bacterium]